MKLLKAIKNSFVWRWIKEAHSTKHDTGFIQIFVSSIKGGIALWIVGTAVSTPLVIICWYFGWGFK